MKNKSYCIALCTLIAVSLISIGFNIYFCATKPLDAGGVFNATKSAVVEVKANTDDIGTSYGSGVIVDSAGLIVTNAHVITYKSLGQSVVFADISIRLIDEQDFRSVEVDRYDLDLDIAVLRLVCDRTLTHISIGNDSRLDYGDAVYAVGNMSNYGISMTAGSVAIPHINVTYNDITRNVIQCDLTISDGNSGGALVDSKGRLVGITTFRLKDQSNNIIYGISYCIPINTVMEYIKK